MDSILTAVKQLQPAMRRKAQFPTSVDDADAAAGLLASSSAPSANGIVAGTHLGAPLSGQSSSSGMPLPTPPMSRGGLSTKSDLEFFEDLVSEPVLVLGVDISHLSRQAQFLLCASGVFFFSLLYGYLQELLSVHLCGRQLGLFLATVQFCGYTLLSFILRTYVYNKQQKSSSSSSDPKRTFSSASLSSIASIVSDGSTTSPSKPASFRLSLSSLQVPFYLYLGLSLLRAVDLAMTNLAMQYINYPAKTLMKSSRVVFTMLFGVVLAKKRYALTDYCIVFCIMAGLAIFMHADANSSAVFQVNGVVMLTISLICDGAITNMSESIMNQYGVGQDEFIFRMYSIALVAIGSAATLKGDMAEGMVWLFTPGTYSEQQENVPLEQRTWSVFAKITVIALFSTMGFFGSSCSAAITKNFGALTMSITSTARKATTLFLSFLLFDNTCTMEHVLGIVIFIAALTAKSLRRRDKKPKKERRRGRRVDIESGRSRPMIRQSSSFDGSGAIPLALPKDIHYKRGVSDGRIATTDPGTSNTTSLGRGHYHVV